MNDYRNLFCTVLFRNFLVRTKKVSTHSDEIVWDQTKHFPVQVLKYPTNPFNYVKIQMLGDHVTGVEQVVGSIGFHLHDIIKSSPIAGSFDIWGQHYEVGQMDLEMTFLYGLYGYGSSPQLKDPNLKPEDCVQYSLMPRINPAPDQCIPNEAILAVHAVPHPSFIPFGNRAFLSYSKEIKTELENMAKIMYRPKSLMRGLDSLNSVREKVQQNNCRYNDQANNIPFFSI